MVEKESGDPWESSSKENKNVTGQAILGRIKTYNIAQWILISVVFFALILVVSTKATQYGYFLSCQDQGKYFIENESKIVNETSSKYQCISYPKENHPFYGND